MANRRLYLQFAARQGRNGFINTLQAIIDPL
jgi:hypothetical protein